MILDGKCIEKEGATKVTTSIIVFLMTFCLSMAVITFHYERMVAIVSNRFLKSRVNFFFFLMHTRALMTYLLGGGTIYLAEKMIRYGIFKIKVNVCILIHPISVYNFWWESF